MPDYVIKSKKNSLGTQNNKMRHKLYVKTGNHGRTHNQTGKHRKKLYAHNKLKLCYEANDTEITINLN